MAVVRAAGWRPVPAVGCPPAAAWGSDGAPGRRGLSAAPAARGAQRLRCGALAPCQDRCVRAAPCVPSGHSGASRRFHAARGGHVWLSLSGPRRSRPPSASLPSPAPPSACPRLGLPSTCGHRGLAVSRSRPAVQLHQPRTLPWMGTLFPSQAAEASGGREEQRQSDEGKTDSDPRKKLPRRE